MNYIYDVLIPARSGSKGIPHKNIKSFRNKPLLFHSIDHVLTFSKIRYIVISSDSEDYLNLVKSHYECSSLFENKDTKIKTLLRPSVLAEDLTNDLEVFRHYLNILKVCQIIFPTDILHLRPTYPNRKEEYLTSLFQLWEMFRNSYDSCRSVIPIDILPIKTYYIKKQNLEECVSNNNFCSTSYELIPYFKGWLDENKNFVIKEPFNEARQNFPFQSYQHNGCYDLIKTEIIWNKNSMSGDHILPFEMKEENLDIDTKEDFEKNEKIFIH